MFHVPDDWPLLALSGDFFDGDTCPMKIEKVNEEGKIINKWKTV